MSKEKYPDIIELKLKLCFSDAHKRFKTMIKKIEISEEALKRLKAGKYVDGSLCVDKLNNQLTFRAFHRKPRVRKRDRVICYHANGWLKESEPYVPARPWMTSCSTLLRNSSTRLRTARWIRTILNCFDHGEDCNCRGGGRIR